MFDANKRFSTASSNASRRTCSPLIPATLRMIFGDDGVIARARVLDDAEMSERDLASLFSMTMPPSL